MHSRAFGKTGWPVNDIGQGCWEFGGAIQLDGKPDGHTGVTDDESVATIRRAVELGVNFFDTADMYGWGHSEEIVGQALQPYRENVFVASKVGFWHDADGNRTHNESKDYILRACEASLRRLQTDRLDLYQCHLWRTERWAEFLDAFETLQKQGKIRSFGVSTNDFDVVQHFNERGNLSAIQANYNLLDRHAEREVLPYCRQHSIAFVARGPLAMGRLSGKYTRDTQFDANDIRSRWLEGGGRQAFEHDIAIVDRLKPIAARRGWTMTQLAIRYVLNHPDVSVLIPGAKHRTQLEQNVATSALSPLTRDDLVAIEQALAG